MGRKKPISDSGGIEHDLEGACRARMYMCRKNIRGPIRVSEEDAQRDLEAMRGASSLTAVREVARQLKEAAVQERQVAMSALFSEPARQDDAILVSDGGGGALEPEHHAEAAQDGQEVEPGNKEDEESEEYEAGGGTAAKKEGEEEEEEEEEEGEEEDQKGLKERNMPNKCHRSKKTKDDDY